MHAIAEINHLSAIKSDDRKVEPNSTSLDTLLSASRNRGRKQFPIHFRVAIYQTGSETTYLVVCFHYRLLCHRIVACNSCHVRPTRASRL